MNGILIIDKPKDFTSFDMIAVTRKILHERKIGHTGTLDPMATGVLPILIGSATKVQSLLPDTNKEYQAKFQLGMTTDTLDITGKVLSQCQSHISKEEFQKVLENFRGDILQVPPMYSAVSKNGVRLYELARKGIEIEREARKVNISKLILNSFDEDTQSGMLTVSCSKGTYIRSLCDDIGKVLNCGAVMTDLRRTFACGYSIADAVTLDELKNTSDFSGILKSVDSIFTCYDSVQITEKQAFRFSNGGGLMLSRINSLENIVDGKFYRVYFEENFLGLGIISLEKQELSVKKKF